MNQKKNPINKISKQANVNASSKNGYKESNYQTPSNKNVFKFSNSLNYNSYSDLVDGLLSDKSLSINRNHKFYNINNNKSRNNIRKKNKTNNSNDDTVRDEDDDEEDDDDDDEEEEDDDEENDEDEEEEEDDDEEDDEDEDDEDDDEDEDEEEDEDRQRFNRKMSTDSIDENNKKKKNNLFYKDLDKSNKQNNVNTKNENSDYYDIYSNIYSYYDIFTEGQNGLSKFKYFNNVFSNYDQKGEKNDSPHDQNSSTNNTPSNNNNNNSERFSAASSSYIKGSGAPPSFNNPQTRIPNDKAYKTAKNLIKEERENSNKYTSGQSNNDNSSVNRQNIFIDQNNSTNGMNNNNPINQKSQYSYSNKLKEKKNELNKNIGNCNNTKKKIITKKRKKKKSITEDTIINDRESTFYEDLKRNMTTNNNASENITGDNRMNSGPTSNNNNIFSSYANKNKSKLSHIKTMASSFIEKNFFYNNNMYKGFTTPAKNSNKINSSKNDEQAENAMDSEQDQDSNIHRRNLNHENKENEENSDNNEDEEYDNNFSSKESNTTNLSIDSSCSIEMDYKNDKEVLRNLEKDLNYDKGKGIPKFLKNPAKKRMNKLKKIIEILEYSIYNEERKGNKLEKKLYQYVLLTKNLKKEIYNLELTNSSSKNKITTYEKDIIKLKEQNEEMKLTLSTFENELSSLINKFDKNFAKELIDTKSKNDILKKEVERLKKEIELKNSEIKKIESYNDITKKNTSDPAAVSQSDNMNSEPIPDPVSSASNISNSFIASNPTNSSIPSNSTNVIGFENNTEPALPRNNNNISNTSNTHNNFTNISSNPPHVTVSHEFPFYYGTSEEVPQNNVDEFIAKIKNNRIIFDKNIDKYDEETKSAIYGCHISNIILENPDICNHKKVLKILQDHCVSESRLLNIHMSLKRERCDNYISQKELEKEVIRQIENMNFDKSKDKNMSIINSIVLTLILKNIHIFNLYKIFILSLKYDNFRWVKIIKKALFLKFFDLSLIDFEIKINEPSKVKETKLIHILGGTNAVLSNENNVEIEANQNVQYNIKHPLFYCPNELLKRLMYDMYLNFTKEPINPQNNDNIYHYILQKKNYDLLKLLKLSGKNISFIFNKNSDNKTPLDYVENEDIHIDLISGYILDIAGKGAENYKNYRYEQAYQLYSEALEKQIKLSNSIKLGSSKSMNENIGKLYYNRARTLMHLNKWIDAIDNCNNCLKYIPKYINAYDTQIHAYEYLLEYDNALSIYKTMCIKCNIKPDDKEDKLKAQMNATAFQILNINKNSTVVEIKQAFSNLSKKWHPDKLGINTSEDIKKRHNNHFKRLFKAKQLLLNDLERYKEKKKKETNFVYPQIIDDSSLAHRNESNNNNNAENQDKKSNLVPSQDSSYDQTKENKKASEMYETSGPDSNNGLNKNGSHTNLFNSYKDDIEKFQEKLKNLNKGINSNDNDVSKNINPFNNVFDNKGSNEKVDENFYKKLKEEYEGLNDDQLNNFKTKISNSINNLIQTEINLKREYQELCNKEKNNAIMNARLCILQEIQKALCVRLDKERRLKIIETVLKDKSGNNASTSTPTNDKEDEKVNAYPHPSKPNKQNTSTEEEVSGDVPIEKNRNSNNGDYANMEENAFKSSQEYSEQNQPNNNVETGSKTEKGKNENQSFDENEEDEIEEGYHSRGKYYEYYYDDKNNRYIKEQNDEDFINDTTYDQKKFQDEMQQGKNYYDSKGYENGNVNNDDNINNEKGGNKKGEQHNIREEDTDNLDKRNIQDVSNSNKISDSNSSSHTNSQTNCQTNSGMNDNGNVDNPDDGCGQNRKRNSKENLNKVWKNEQINELNKISEKNQIPNDHTNFLFMNEEHKNKDVYNSHFDNMTNTKQVNQPYRNSNTIYEYMSATNNQYPKTHAVNNSQTNTETKNESYPFGSKARPNISRNLNTSTDEINTKDETTGKMHINNNETFYEEKENANIETNGYINKYHPKERIINSDASNNEKAEQDVTNHPVGEQDSEKKYTAFSKNNQANEENVNDSTNNYYDKDSVYLMYNPRNPNLLDKMAKKKNENSINKTDSVEGSDKERETYYNEDNEINKINFKNKNDEYITSHMIGSNNDFLKKISSNNSSRNIHTINSERLIQKKVTYPNDNTKKKQTMEKRASQKESGNVYNNSSDNEQDQYSGHNGETKHYDSSFYGKSYVSTNKSVSNIKNNIDKKLQKNFDSSEDFSNYNENNNFYNIHNDEYKTYHFSNEQTDQDINKNYLNTENPNPSDNIKSYSFHSNSNAYTHDQRENMSPKKK
ncbi:conserved Plasmodium protein, unknown function [Plasmodium chabaudi adami]|uniref:J domain-containing protein n=1 Tax=Plasmodium chabaudi adami TaxID=5826 RepID=A0A1D3LIJ4_PLACE|nr:conserved Plasmodium protein, unknown function [Plasmodium chabaudi adami]